MSPRNGFTLAELLIALVILGVIATFTIPKVLQSQQSSQWKSVTKESFAALSGAFEAYKQQNTVATSTSATHLTPYLNYVKVYSTGSIDDSPGRGTASCAGTDPCLMMHNGAIIFFNTAVFGSTGGNQRVLEFLIDPDGKLTNNQDSIWLELYYNGRVTTWATSTPFYYSDTGPYGTGPDPAWFNWN